MKAARFYDKSDIRIEDIPEPQVTPGTVGIQVAWCGISMEPICMSLWMVQFLFRLVAIRIQSRANLLR